MCVMRARVAYNIGRAGGSIAAATSGWFSR